LKMVGNEIKLLAGHLKSGVPVEVHIAPSQADLEDRRKTDWRASAAKPQLKKIEGRRWRMEKSHAHKKRREIA